MNWKNLSIATLFAALSLGAVSAQAQDGVTPHNYMYGDHLDIAHVLSTKDSGTCGQVTTRMTYLDSHGQTQVLNYLTIAQDCPGDN